MTTIELDRAATIGRPAAPVRATAPPAATSRLGDLLFRSTRMAPVWLLVRAWLGYEWFAAGWEKLRAPSAGGWFGAAPALAGFSRGADAVWANRAKAFGHPNVHYAWFLDVLHFVADHGWLFGPIVVLSELAIGVGLLTGTLTRWAALGAVALNVLYVMGGSAGVNGVFFATGALLVAAGPLAGHWGGDGLLRRRAAGRPSPDFTSESLR